MKHTSSQSRPHSYHLKQCAAFLSLVIILSTNLVIAQTTQTLSSPLDPKLNPNSSEFRIVVCDGPTLPTAVKAKLPKGADFVKEYGHQPPYVPCDFNHVMIQIRHLINIMMVFGILAAIASFTFAGGLYITGKKGNIERAHKIFPKVFTGFIIMLSAWFIVYQILSWLTDDSKGGSAFKALLGSPS